MSFDDCINELTLTFCPSEAIISRSYLSIPAGGSLSSSADTVIVPLKSSHTQTCSIFKYLFDIKYH